MIRVNLLNATTATNTTTLKGEPGFTATQEEGVDQRQLALKLLVILLFPGLHMFYQYQNLSTLRAQSNTLNRELKHIESEIKSHQDVAEVLKQLSTEKKHLESQMESIRTLNKDRLRAIKALDTLQNVIPDNVWLEAVKMDGTKVQITGHSTSAEGISVLVKRLEDSVFFTDVLLTSSIEEQMRTGPNLKKFEVSAGLGDVQ